MPEKFRPCDLFECFDEKRKGLIGIEEFVEVQNEFKIFFIKKCCFLSCGRDSMLNLKFIYFFKKFFKLFLNIF